MGNKVRVLFVDDQQEILDGLKRMSRSMRSEWNVSFALGGEKALQVMLSAPFDVLVTDMRMPGMNGAELLKRVHAAYPHMIRIVLSGQYDVGSFVKSGWPAHQFLSKPCDAAALKNTIIQAMSMREMLENETLRVLVTRVDCLPSLPKVYLEIEEELKSEHTSMQKVGDIISEDVGLTAKVLQLVNSPFFGSSRKIESPNQAAVMLGADILKALVLYLQSCSEIKMPVGVSLDEISSHGVRVGNLAREIARMEGHNKDTCAEAFLAGLLQNIGSLIILGNFSEEYKKIVSESARGDNKIWEVEKGVLGASHAEIGAYLLSLWGISQSVVEAVAYHNEPSKCTNDNYSFVLIAVHAANAMEKDSTLGPAFIENEFDFDYLEKQGLSDRLPDWQKLHQQMMDQKG